MAAPERIRIREGFAAILKNANVDANKIHELARKLERGVFEVAIHDCERDGVDRLFSDQKFKCRYSAATFRISYNLENSPDLISRLVAGLDPDSCGKMTSEELWPQCNAEERQNIAASKRAAAKEGKVSRRYVCRICRDNRTVFIEYQAQAADEISSKSIKCVTCQHVWRE